MSQTLSGERSLARFSGLFAMAALALAVAGLYGVTLYATWRRTNEIGIRIALGASRIAVIGMVIRGTVVLMAIGFAAGIPAALAAMRLIRSSVVENSDGSRDSAGVASLMLVVGLCGQRSSGARIARRSRKCAAEGVIYTRKTWGATSRSAQASRQELSTGPKQFERAGREGLAGRAQLLLIVSRLVRGLPATAIFVFLGLAQVRRFAPAFDAKDIPRLRTSVSGSGQSELGLMSSAIHRLL